jgi:hypothetical protein
VPLTTSFTRVIWKVYNCPRSKILNLNDICSCGDKQDGAPGCETGPFGLILAVPLNMHLHPLGHCGLNLDALMYFVIKQLPYDIMCNMCCVENINDLSSFYICRYIGGYTY